MAATARACCCLALAALAAPVCAQSVPSGRIGEPKTVDEVVARHVAALGGSERLAARNSLRLTGKVIMGAGVIEARLVQEFKRPGKFRADITIDQGPSIVQACDGRTWWYSMPMFGRIEPEEMPPDMARLMAVASDLDGTLVDYRAKGHRVDLLGRDVLEEQAVFKLRVVPKGTPEGEFDEYFLDAKTFLLVRIAGHRTFQGNPAPSVTLFSEYRPIAGVMVAHLIRQHSDQAPGMDSKNIVEKAETNIDIPDERFSMAAAASAVQFKAAVTTRPVIKDDSAARAVYERMIAALRSAESLAFESRYELSMGGVPVAKSSYRAWLKKPNCFRIETTNPAGGRAGTLIGDGTRLWIHWPEGRPMFDNEDPAEYARTKQNVYMTKVTPNGHHSIGHEVGLLGAGIVMNILDLSTFHGYTDSLQPLIDAIGCAEPQPVGDEPCDVVDVGFMDGQRTWRLWISQRDHLPRKLDEVVRVATELNARETWTNVRLNAEIENEQFAWTPPDGWREWRLPESESLLLKTGQIAPDFEAKLADGTTTHLSDHRGKVVWLVFWRVG